MVFKIEMKNRMAVIEGEKYFNNELNLKHFDNELEFTTTSVLAALI